MANEKEAFFSVDVETAGPYPGRYSLLSIGACLVTNLQCTFYVELKPTSPEADPKAMAISGLSLAVLAEHGVPPAEAMAKFEDWVLKNTLVGQRPVFVAFNAPFDWSFVSEYFQRFLGRNPFGHSALDLKALYMGLTGAPWSETSLRYVAARYLGGRPLAHHALSDAQDQGEMFRHMIAEASTHGFAWI